jgi:uncharacterized lipoprotein YajG
MKKSFVLFASIAALAICATTARTLAADKEETIKGEGKCGKCSLKETKSCQNVIQVTKDGKTETYYLAQNDVSKKFHENVCQETKKVTATGSVKTVDGKKELTVSKIEVDK